MTYDYGYEGTGNWPFNTAYAATRTEQAFVTRFASLRGVERFIKAGIPVIVSVTFGAGGLDGSPLPRGTNGHLLVVVGFTSTGDVVVNDPAAADARRACAAPTTAASSRTPGSSAAATAARAASPT